jgi:hypothetical protein
LEAAQELFDGVESLSIGQLISGMVSFLRLHIGACDVIANSNLSTSGLHRLDIDLSSSQKVKLSHVQESTPDRRFTYGTFIAFVNATGNEVMPAAGFGQLSARDRFVIP